MPNASRYCSHCGKPLNPQANFCGACGKPTPARTAPLAAHRPQSAVPAPAAQVAVQAQAVPHETVVGVLAGASRRSGFMGLKAEAFALVLTDQRILFAAQTNAMMKENVQRARDEARQQGKGFFGQWGAQLGANSGKQYLQMTPAAILSENPANTFYHAGQIRSIRVREAQGDEDSVSTYWLEIETAVGKEKFHFNHLDTRAVKRQLQQLYGDIVR